MPDLSAPSFLHVLLVTHAGALIGGVCLGAAAVLYVQRWRGVERHPFYVAPDPAFEPSRAWLQEAEPGVVEVRMDPEPAEPPRTQQVRKPRGLWLDEQEGKQLARLICDRGEVDGVKLTHQAMKDYGFTAEARRNDILQQVIERGKGYRRNTTGGKVTVWLRPEVAARHVERCREKGIYLAEDTQ